MMVSNAAALLENSKADRRDIIVKILLLRFERVRSPSRRGNDFDMKRSKSTEA
jgi:hypothetical protein